MRRPPIPIDGREHGVTLDQVGSAVAQLPPEAIAINIRCDSATNNPAGLPPRRILFQLDYW